MFDVAGRNRQIAKYHDNVVCALKRRAEISFQANVNAARS
jgi:hypothetical protein